MNLLMIILIVLAIWVCAAICYFAWQVMPKVESPPPPAPGPDASPPDEASGNDNGDPEARR